jgi:hypothetical protein
MYSSRKDVQIHNDDKIGTAAINLLKQQTELSTDSTGICGITNDVWKSFEILKNLNMCTVDYSVVTLCSLVSGYKCYEESNPSLIHGLYRCTILLR